jgi:beta-N-acetylhexosaminidase
VDELSRAVHGLLVPGFDAEPDRLPAWTSRRLERGLAGVVLFARNVGAGLRMLTDAVHGVRPSALVAIDEEGGDVTRLEASTGSRHPGARALGALDDEAVTREVAGSIGAVLAEAGVDWNWAPVADLASDGRNPVVGVRSFGADPQRVAAHVAATVRGFQDDAGILACAKHFPGHGATDVDSHLRLPTVVESRAQLASGALVPFRAAIDAGVASVMTGHLRMLALDPDVPATFSSLVLQSLLRDELGFDGVVVSDALEMRGATTGHDIGVAAVLAVRAGVDALCLGGHLADDDVVALVHDALVAAVRDGELDEARVVDAASRVAMLAQRRHDRPTFSHAAALDLEACTRIAARALSVDGRPVLGGGTPLVVVCESAASIPAGTVRWGLTHPLREVRPDALEVVVRDDGPTVVPVPPLADSAQGRVVDRSALLARAAAHDGPVLLVQRDAGRQEWQQDLETAVVAARPDAIVVELGVPADRFATAAARITAYGASRSSTAAVVALLTDTEGRP